MWFSSSPVSHMSLLVVTQHTGDIRWQRVVNASQKEGIYNWLREHFPVKAAEAPAIKKTGRKTQLASV